MPLTVGQLARHSGLTVRTLHHFDQIGLLRPAGRSAAGYRLYGDDDLARLQAILALRQLGLPLQQIAGLLDGPAGGGALPQVLARQVQALDTQIAEATALRQRLALLVDRFAEGRAAEPGAWLDGLTALTAYARHFSPDELRRLLGRWRAVQAEWTPLQAAVRAAMDAGLQPDDPAAQPLAQQWMGLVHHWLGGDFALIARWGRMVLGEPQARHRGGPDLAMVRWIDQATAPRLAAWQRHFSLAALSRFGHVPAADWQALSEAAGALVAAGTAAGDAAWQPVIVRAQALLRQLAGQDEQRLAQLRQALAAEPLLGAGLPLPGPLLDAVGIKPAPTSPSPTRTPPARPRRAARSAAPSRRTSPG